MTVPARPSEFSPFDHLYVRHLPTGRAGVPLPDWARFMVQLGQYLAQQPLSQGALTVALSVPTREYAAVLAALGVAHGCRHDQPAEFFDEAWAQLSAHPETPLPASYRLHDKPQDGELVRAFTHPEYGRCLSVELPTTIRQQNTGIREKSLYTVPRGRSDLLARLTKEHAKVKHRKLTYYSALQEKLLEGCDQYRYLFTPRHDGMLIGVESWLRSEVKLPLSLSEPLGPPHAGLLEDMVRVAQWNPGEKGNNFAFVSQASETPADLAQAEQFRTAIFDGAGAYLRGHTQFRRAHHLVINDRARTEAQTTRATSVVDGAYEDRNEDDEPVLPFHVPAGIEMLIFRRFP